MKKDKKLEKLFKEINEKPKSLDQDIMLGIYKQVELEKASKSIDLKPWIWTIVLIGILSVSGLVYAASYINFDKDTLIWILGLSVLTPLILDNIFFSNRDATLD